MSVLNLILAGILVLFVVLLLRANTDIGRNPYQKIKMHEDLFGPFPPSMSDSEKLRLINWRGISSGNTKCIGGLILVVALFFMFLLWQEQ
ncbi:hypothetical protein [Denitratisoma sp. agr-D3]